MFLFRVKVKELDAPRLDSLMADLSRSEESFRAHCPIREMSVVAEGNRKKQGNEVDIYLALDDFIDSTQLRRLVGELNSLLDFKLPDKNEGASLPCVSSELIHI
jgi:hypothetical protein